MALFPDLSGPKVLIERILFNTDQEPVSEVLITWDAQAAADDTFDPNTGLWTQPQGDATTVYEGKAAVRAQDPERLFDVGMQVQLRAEWALRLPLASPEIPIGSIVEITSNARDASQVGRRFRVDRRLGSSFAVVAKYVMFEFKPLHQVLP